MASAAGTAKLVLSTGASVATAAGIAYLAHQHALNQPLPPPLHAVLAPSSTLLAHWKSCNWPAGHNPGNAYAVIDSSLCVALPFFRQARTDLTSVGLFSLAASGILPLLAHLSYTAISPNARVSFISQGLPILAAASHFIGAGFLASGPLVLLYTLGSLLFFTSKRSAFAPLPTRALGAHLVNTICAAYFLAALGFMLLDTAGGKWYKSVLTLLLAPLALVNLPTFVAGFKVPRSEADVRTALATYSAGELSSAFERTWSSYRRIGLASAILYWYGLGRIGNGIIFERPIRLNDAAFHALLTFAGTAAASLALIAVERLTTRPQASALTTQPLPEARIPPKTKAVLAQVTEQTPLPHPLTGAQPSKVDLECERAIARAPAGHPFAEIGWKGTAFATLLGGPGLAASFWWARGEEEAGWKARREWREIQALAAKKE